MHWGQIKTLLILSFLILDVYLFLQFLDKKEQADIGVMEQQPSTIEEQLKEEAITFGDLPDEEYEETFISVKQHSFDEEDLASFSSVYEQETFIFQNYFIASQLETTIPIEEDDTIENIEDVFEQIAYYPEEYSFWNWNEEFNVLVFFQNKLDRPIYYNKNGLVLLFLNDDNEVSFYTQTMLGEEKSLADKRTLIEPIQAIEVLYPKQVRAGDDITKVNIGFHTRVPFETGVQVFAPTWKVKVNDEQDYFVNAIEGFIFSTNEQEFLEEVIESTLDKMQMWESDVSIEMMQSELIQRIESDGVNYKNDDAL